VGGGESIRFLFYKKYMQKYYRVRRSYDSNEDIVITEKELPVAMFCFLHDMKFVSSFGATNKILDILPDHARSMGWNGGYKFTPEDWREVKKKIGRSLEFQLSQAKEVALIATELSEIPALVEQQKLAISERAKLSEKLKLKTL
jgi:hypothetical protein